MATITTWGYADRYDLIANAPAGTDFAAVSCGFNHAIAIVDDGSLTGWGRDTHGEVSGIPSGNDFVDIAAAGCGSLALRSTGAIEAWGTNGFPQADRVVDEAPAGTGFAEVAVGAIHDTGFALDASGAVQLWGYLSEYYGDPSPPIWLRDPLSAPPAGGGFSHLRAGFRAAGVLDGDGHLHLFGQDYAGQIGQAPAGEAFTDFALGPGFVVALRTDGTLATWGTPHLNLPAYYGIRDPGEGMPTGNGFVAVATPWTYGGLAIDDSGALHSWGNPRPYGGWPSPPAGTFTAVGGRYVLAALG